MASAPSPPRPDADAPARSADEPSYYNISQAAALLGVSRVTVSRWIRAGRLPVARLGHRTARIRREDLEVLLAARGPATSGVWVVPDATIAVQARNGLDGRRALRATWRETGAAGHVVQFYEADAVLLDAVGEYIGAALRGGETGIVIATPAHRDGVEARLRADGLDPDAARAGGRYVALDAAETLARFMVDGEPEPGRFAEVVGSLIARAAEGGRAVRAFGEMVALLAADGKPAAAIRLEALWNGLRQVHTFALFCAYPTGVLGGEGSAAVFDEIAGEHGRVIPAESYTALDSPDARLREIARLQQQAAALEAEIVERERFEMAALRLAAIVQSSDDAIIGKTLEGVITDWNRGAQRIYGYAADEVIGRPITLLIPRDRPDELPAILERLRRGERIDHYETERVTKDGRRISVSVTISPVRDAGGRLVGASAVARDVTERKQAERERAALLAREQEARAAAEAALRLRDEFLSVAAHELRTPLTSLSGYAQLAMRRLERSGRLEPERAAEALGAIASQSDKLNRLLSRLLDISRLEAGGLALERQPTDLVALVGQAVDGARARGAAHPITLAAPPSLEADVDPLRLEQVLTNLLDNATKYSPDAGPIEVAVSRSSDGAAEVAVRDHGLGIPPEMRARIFERFYQAHGSGHRSGLGLGLYVSREIVELHGGTISAEFPPDGGSRFVMRLPLTREGGPPDSSRWASA